MIFYIDFLHARGGFRGGSWGSVETPRLKISFSWEILDKFDKFGIVYLP